ncbi:uncharacterized protein LOC126845416 [Adelges cooleyi]|uniref:uncharacterized protein LOC126845416 n=1 Tax=Adelges cooleyi TaxID=133065 RepID=UPI00217F4A52|nr:uncharacterized protein LOC126845416 [Adelges cooleyi]
MEVSQPVKKTKRKHVKSEVSSSDSDKKTFKEKKEAQNDFYTSVAHTSKMLTTSNEHIKSAEHRQLNASICTTQSVESEISSSDSGKKTFKGKKDAQKHLYKSVAHSTKSLTASKEHLKSAECRQLNASICTTQSVESEILSSDSDKKTFKGKKDSQKHLYKSVAHSTKSLTASKEHLKSAEYSL